MSKEKNINTSKTKPKFNTKMLKYGAVATGFTIVVIAMVILVNVILGLVGERVNLKLDITSDGIFEISQESIDYLEQNKENIEIAVMIPEESFESNTNVYYKQAYEVLKKYQYYSDNISLKFVDLVKDPSYATKYNELYKGEIANNDIVIASEKRVKVINLYDLYNTELNYQTYSYDIMSSKAEQVLTSAIMYITDPNPMTAVILDVETVNSANMNITYNVTKILEDNGYNVVTVNPMTEAIPTENELIVINAPLNDFTEDTIKTLYDYMENGGNYGKNLIYLANSSQKPTANIDAFLAEWGFQIGTEVIGETDQYNLMTQDTLYAIKNFIDMNENEYAKNVAQADLPVVAFRSRPVNLLFSNNGNVSAKSLLSTADTAFLFTNDMQAQIENGEQPTIVNGTYNTMAISTKYVFNDDNEYITSNFLVVGGSEMLDSGLTSASFYNNGDYFISAVNKMTGKEKGITIVSKNLNAPTFQTDVQKITTSFWTFVILIPLAVIICGIVVWVRRRNR